MLYIVEKLENPKHGSDQNYTHSLQRNRVVRLLRYIYFFLDIFCCELNFHTKMYVIYYQLIRNHLV